MTKNTTFRICLVLVAGVLSAAGAFIPATRTQAGDCPGVKCNPPVLVVSADEEACVSDAWQSGGCWGSHPNVACNSQVFTVQYCECRYGWWDYELQEWHLGGDTCDCEITGSAALNGCTQTAIPPNCE